MEALKEILHKKHIIRSYIPWAVLAVFSFVLHSDEEGWRSILNLFPNMYLAYVVLKTAAKNDAHRIHKIGVFGAIVLHACKSVTGVFIETDFALVLILHHVVFALGQLFYIFSIQPRSSQMCNKLLMIGFLSFTVFGLAVGQYAGVPYSYIDGGHFMLHVYLAFRTCQYIHHDMTISSACACVAGYAFVFRYFILLVKTAKMIPWFAGGLSDLTYNIAHLGMAMSVSLYEEEHKGTEGAGLIKSSRRKPL